MKTKLFVIISSILCSIGFLISCDDETSKIGSGIVQGEVNISIDSLILNLNAMPLEVNQFDSKTGNLLLGNIQVPEYGSLNCSFVTRLMCAPTLDVPDSLFNVERVDSCILIMALQRNQISGDSLAPQKLEVYLLNRQLPQDIDNNFDPQGFYDPADLLGTKSYTVSNMGASDSVFYNQEYIELNVNLDKEFAKEVFEKYKTDPEIFQWPQTFAQYIPGLYVKSSFGKGCVANITQAYVGIFYHSKVLTTSIEDGDTIKSLTNKREVAVPFTVSPEVVSSNNISYKVSDKIKELNQSGDIVITTPGGYNASFRFPAEKIIELYNKNENHLSLVNDLLVSIPADSLDNKIGIGVAPNLLMIKDSEYEDFFNKKKIPDNKIAFTGTFNKSAGCYNFSSMRNYILDLLKMDEIPEEDLVFRIVPVEISTETVNNNYYGTGTTYVTKCVPYTVKPTMTRLHTEEALIVFSFSSELIK